MPDKASDKSPDKVRLSYYSDVLCIWAYTGQIRLDELAARFGSQISVEHHFISIFGHTEERIGGGWKNKGGFEGFSNHVMQVAEGFPHVKVNQDIWKSVIPSTSAMSHLFLKAVQLLEKRGTISPSPDSDSGKTVFEELLWRTRCAFFEDARDVSNQSTLYSLAEEMKLPINDIERLLKDGSAIASLVSDMDKKERFKLEGSPSYIMNEGRQKLYGNVGYRVIEANVIELLETGEKQASWC